MADAVTHVVLGTGPVGLSVAEVLAAAGRRVRVVNRSGRVGEALPSGVEVSAADLAGPVDWGALAGGAQVVFNCMNAAYDRWAELLPPIWEAAVAASEASGARLVVMDNLYAYGSPGGRPMTEDLPNAAKGRKGRLRGDLADRLLRAHQEGRARIAIGRASDFFGPRVLGSAMGERVLPPLLAGQPAQVLGNPGRLHTYSYVPDVARALVVLSERDEALGQVWHLPAPETVTTREMVTRVAAELGVEPKLRSAPGWLLRVVGVFNPMLREVAEMAYEFEEPFVMDDSKFRRAFDFTSTPLEDAIRATAAWYKAAMAREGA